MSLLRYRGTSQKFVSVTYADGVILYGAALAVFIQNI